MANLLGSPLESRRSPHGKPQSTFRRVSISAAWYESAAASVASALLKLGFAVSQRLVGKLLRELDYSCQANRKTLEGSSHPDRKSQVEHINATVKAAHDVCDISANHP